MSLYKLTLILKIELDKEKREELLKKIKDTINNKDEGEIKNVSDGKVRKLAYEIDKNKEGIFTTIDFEILPSKVKEIKDFLKTQEGVIRAMITKVEKPLKASNKKKKKEVTQLESSNLNRQSDS
ncbi:30S ribosomal protein S6 [Candidatus Aerophobetes bacterium]|nr:30S ribosomal protein S6 [Candidatus Aerophobetes bacterium]